MDTVLVSYTHYDNHGMHERNAQMADKRSYSKEDLINLQPVHETFVGIDSDGCVFDTMEVKQKQHFHPLILKFWGLEKVERQVREAAEFFNLYSKWRGQNRFVDLLEMFKALPDMPGVQEAGIELPDYSRLQAYVESGLPLGNPSLAAEVERTGDAELRRLLEWSLEINRDIDENMGSIPPFPSARKSIEKVAMHSDVIVVSQTPEEALVKEWAMHDLAQYVRVIAGQELGKKSEHLQMATQGRFSPDRILMIGDAPGDRKAAEANNAFFYPINPGQEEESWQRFYAEAFDRFVAGEFGGAYQQVLNEEFEALLPEAFPWA